MNHVPSPEVDGETSEASCTVCGEHVDLRWVHGTEAVALEDGCECSGPPGWHCPGEDSQHWATPTGECGHCGWAPV